MPVLPRLTALFLAVLPSALLCAQEPRKDAASPVIGETARAELAPKVSAARAILDGWQAKDPEKAQRKLHVVYWTPQDREPAPQYRERLSKILEDVRSFYAREMERLGFGPRTIQFDHASDGLIQIHLVHGLQPYAKYDVKSGSEIRGECLSVLRQAGINPARETIVIFCNMSNWEAGARRISQNSPYYASGTPMSGTAWQVDSPILNLDGLADTGSQVQDGQYGHISLGRYNSIFIGGIAHELGHSLTLPHCRARDDEHAAFGTSLMGSGNRTYGEEKRHEGPGTFLTLGEGMRLASHPIFCGSIKGTTLPPSVKPANLKIEAHGQGFVVSGTALADPPVYGIVAYMDPEGGDDYDSTTCTAVPAADGHFVLDCQALRPGKAGELRLTFLQANGVPSGPLSSTPFRYPYAVAADGTVDLGAAHAKLILAPLVEALNAGRRDEVQQLLKSPAIAGDSQLRASAERLLGTLTPKLRAPSELPSEYKSVPLADLSAVQEKVGYGRPLRDRLPAPEGPLLSGGKLFLHGLFAHAESTYEWQLDGTWKTLAGSAGIAHVASGSVQAVIEGDGKILWQSKTLKNGAATPFSVNLEGVKSLVLKMTDAGDGTRSDWGVWLEPTLAR